MYVRMYICMHVSLVLLSLFIIIIFFNILLYFTHLCSGFSWLFRSQFLTTHLEKRYGNLMFLVSMFIVMVTNYYSMSLAQLLKDEVGMDWADLAQSYELTGGLIRNAMLSSIALASKRTFGDDSISLTFEDLYNGAKLQLRYFTML